MKIEHIALNVSEPVEVAEWYTRHCGLQVVRHIPQPSQTHFLSDGESTVLEIYCNLSAEVPDYKSMNPLLLHLALVSTDPVSDAQRLMAAGANWVEEIKTVDGSHLIMLRDPWGLALQLCLRAVPLPAIKA